MGRALLLGTTLCFVTLLAGLAWAQEATPPEVAAFQQRQAEMASDPVGAVTVWFEAIFQYMADPELGAPMITLAMDDPDWNVPANSIFVDRLNNRPRIFLSYIRGTSPENGYQPGPEADWELEVTEVREPDANGEVTVYLRSTGADTPRPMAVRKGDDGLFRASRYTSIYVDVRPPKG